jgi:hypothetical protein
MLYLNIPAVSPFPLFESPVKTGKSISMSLSSLRSQLGAVGPCDPRPSTETAAAYARRRIAPVPRRGRVFEPDGPEFYLLGQLLEGDGLGWIAGR